MDEPIEKTLGELISDLKVSKTPKQQSKSRKTPETFSSKAEKARQERISNDILEGDQAMKRWSLLALFIFLGLETIAIFVIVFFQGFGLCGFHIEEWNFRLVVAGTLIQITTMLEVAIRHLFPPASR